MAMLWSSILLVLFISFFLFVSFSLAEIRFTEIRSNDRYSVIPLDEFQFTHNGRLELSVSQVTISNQIPYYYLDKVGFFVCTRHTWALLLQQQLADGKVFCALSSPYVRVIFDLRSLKVKLSFNTVFPVRYADHYILAFSNCLDQVNVSMTVQSAMYNLEGNKDRRDYLSANQAILPSFYFLLSLFYFTLAGIWLYLLHKKPLSVSRTHFIMLADKEKKVLLIVIPFQVVVANIAQVFIDKTPLFSPYRVVCKQIVLLVDVFCYCAVLLPIVWSIEKLREVAQTDEKAAVKLKKLTLFRQYYIMVICYIYFPRIMVYTLETTITVYKYSWSRVLVGELATLTFYVYTGYEFKPKADNLYFPTDDEEEEGDLEQLKLRDEEKMGND
ncbi:hypothetical protein Goklo_019317 [Gossypium klotzschianum]|uniref:Uncharacterized protein n=1 Tax=Gossypium klotzschianum TaxID=34286 RepID=A0A7J8UNU3_9ROSI|nr:hypothetical protein [Gossypium klotzschianum]